MRSLPSKPLLPFMPSWIIPPPSLLPGVAATESVVVNALRISRSWKCSHAVKPSGYGRGLNAWGRYTANVSSGTDIPRS